MYEEDKGYLRSFSVVIPPTHIPIEQYTSNCSSQTCSGKGKTSIEKDVLILTALWKMQLKFLIKTISSLSFLPITI